ncbi:MAG TPA: hypothetical protein DDZ51_06455 [Planctomycetaceae bacterium]|nr:hypothetical protein [Planctomycetaceae bacterium]
MWLAFCHRRSTERQCPNQLQVRESTQDQTDLMHGKTLNGQTDLKSDRTSQISSRSKGVQIKGGSVSRSRQARSPFWTVLGIRKMLAIPCQ